MKIPPHYPKRAQRSFIKHKHSAGLALASLAIVALSQAPATAVTITIDQGDIKEVNDGAVYYGYTGQEGDKKGPVPFLETKSVRPSPDNGFTAGYNDGEPTDILDNTTDPLTTFTYDYDDMIVLGDTLALADVPRVHYDFELGDGYIEYFAFVLDGNEDDGFLEAHQLEIWTSSQPTVTTEGDARSGNLAYNLDAGGVDRTLQLSAATGTSNWNVALYIPVTSFTLENGDTTGENTYVHFYFQYYGESGGKDQWGTDEGALIPEPSGIMLLSLGAVATLLKRRRA